MIDPLQILETTSELKEVGAAVSIGGGGGKILRRFGIDLAHEGGIVPDAFAIWTIDGNKIADVPAPSPERFGDHLVRDLDLEVLCLSDHEGM
jgi:2-polyprenyl-6-methoxyphenol hydroxylase-like FAD-dependent oxidoreductase